MIIKIAQNNKDEFTVTVETDGDVTTHLVTLDDQYWMDLTDEKMSKEELIKISFEFLLERESNQSILKSFNLKEIKKYFPEFETKVQQ